MVDRLSIKYEMSKLDNKDRDYYDNLSDEEKKKFSLFMLLRWGSAVTGSSDMQMYYLQSMNQKYNKNFFSIPKEHNKLNWLAASTISPGMGEQSHYWLKGPSYPKANSKVSKFLSDLYPSMKMDEIELLSSLNSIETLKALAENLGMSKEQIKKELG